MHYTDYETYTPSPEAIYIGNESGFLKIINEYNSGERTLNDIISAYIALVDGNFNFSEIKKAYEKLFLEIGIDDDYKFLLDVKRDFQIFKEKFESFQTKPTVIKTVPQILLTGKKINIKW